jgi:hypothetical protein
MTVKRMDNVGIAAARSARPGTRIAPLRGQRLAGRGPLFRRRPPCVGDLEAGDGVGALMKSPSSASSPAPLAAAVVAAIFLSSGAPKPASHIHVGRNIQVSWDHPDLFHGELWAASDPRDGGRLILASMASDPATVGERSIVYVSKDHGRTWASRLVTADQSEDPATAFGADGTAYFLHLNEGRGTMEVFRSPDSGEHWAGPVVGPFSDRPYLAVSPTGKLFIDGHVRGQNQRSFLFSLITSNDGKVFSPVLTSGEDGPLGVTPGGGVFLSDGAYVAVIEDLSNLQALASRDVRKQLGWIGIVTSIDGGKTLEPPRRAADWWNATDVDYLGNLPHIAVDATSGRFKDRLYLAWSDTRSGRSEIWLTWSKDRGRTWSEARRVNDDASRSTGPGPDHLQPAVAVNSRGVVGVSWYDRRDAPDNRGWRARFSASLDGGETFLPSVAASEVAYVPANSRPARMVEIVDKVVKNTGAVNRRPRWSFAFIGGDTGTIATTSDGAFHLFWPDNRTGVTQIWTAEARVD